MYRCGFVSTEYVVEAVYQSMMNRRNSAKRNYQRAMYESVEENTELKFGEMLDTEMKLLREGCDIDD